MNPDTARLLATGGTVLTVGMLVFTLTRGRRPMPVRVGLDVLRAAISLAAVVGVAAITGVTTNPFVAAGAAVAGGLLGTGQGRVLRVAVHDGRVLARRTTLGVLLWGAGMVTSQAAGIASRSGLLALGQAVAWFSLGLNVGLLLARHPSVQRARLDLPTAKAVVAGAGVVAFLVGVTVPFGARRAGAVDDLTSGQICDLIPRFTNGTAEGFYTPEAYAASGSVASCEYTVTYAADQVLNVYVQRFASEDEANVAYDRAVELWLDTFGYHGEYPLGDESQDLGDAFAVRDGAYLIYVAENHQGPSYVNPIGIATELIEIFGSGSAPPSVTTSTRPTTTRGSTTTTTRASTTTTAGASTTTTEPSGSTSTVVQVAPVPAGPLTGGLIGTSDRPESGSVGDGQVTPDEALASALTVMLTALVLGVIDISEFARWRDTGEPPPGLFDDEPPGGPPGAGPGPAPTQEPEGALGNPYASSGFTSAPPDDVASEGAPPRVPAPPAGPPSEVGEPYGAEGVPYEDIFRDGDGDGGEAPLSETGVRGAPTGVGVADADGDALPDTGVRGAPTGEGAEGPPAAGTDEPGRAPTQVDYDAAGARQVLNADGRGRVYDHNGRHIANLGPDNVLRDLDGNPTRLTVNAHDEICLLRGDRVIQYDDTGNPVEVVQTGTPYVRKKDGLGPGQDLYAGDDWAPREKVPLADGSAPAPTVRTDLSGQTPGPAARSQWTFFGAGPRGELYGADGRHIGYIDANGVKTTLDGTRIEGATVEGGRLIDYRTEHGQLVNTSEPGAAPGAAEGAPPPATPGDPASPPVDPGAPTVPNTRPVDPTAETVAATPPVDPTAETVAATPPVDPTAETVAATPPVDGDGVVPRSDGTGADAPAPADGPAPTRHGAGTSGPTGFLDGRTRIDGLLGSRGLDALGKSAQITSLAKQYIAQGMPEDEAWALAAAETFGADAVGRVTQGTRWSVGSPGISTVGGAVLPPRLRGLMPDQTGMELVRDTYRVGRAAFSGEAGALDRVAEQIRQDPNGSAIRGLAEAAHEAGDYLNDPTQAGVGLGDLYDAAVEENIPEFAEGARRGDYGTVNSGVAHMADFAGQASADPGGTYEQMKRDVSTLWNHATWRVTPRTMDAIRATPVVGDVMTVVENREMIADYARRKFESAAGAFSAWWGGER